MNTHTLLVVAHPDRDSLTHHVAARIEQAVGPWGSVEVADLHSEGFDPRFSPADRSHYLDLAGAVPPDVVAEQSRLDRASDLVVVFPAYWWSMPALLKGWIDRVFINGWAFGMDAQERVVPRLQRLTTHVVAVAGGDEELYARHGYAASMRNQIAHGIVGYCGSRLGAFSFVHDSEDASAATRASSVSHAVAGVAAAYEARLGAPRHGYAMSTASTRAPGSPDRA